MNSSVLEVMPNMSFQFRSDHNLPDSPIGPGFPTGLILVILAAVGLGLSAPGCNNTTAKAPAKSAAASPGKTAANSGPASGPSRRCQTLLSSGLDMLQPDHFEISADPNAAADSLNNWARECGSSLPSENAAAPDPLLEKSLPEDQRASALGNFYDLRDVRHIRNCLLLKQAGLPVKQSSSNDKDRIVALFDLACRLIALNGKDEPKIPQSLGEVLIIGKGTVEDRAWVFAELLRQLNIDSAILSPRAPGTAGANASKRWLVGVLLDKQVYLFDPLLGWPIPAALDTGNTPTVRHAATLSEVIANDRLLRKLDVSADKPYPLGSEDLKSVRVEVITSSSFWLPRIKRLEPFLSGKRSVTIYAPLNDIGNHPGLLSRAAGAGDGHWKKEDVVIWDYPDRQTSASRNRDQQAAIIQAARWLPFEGPVEFSEETRQLVSKHKEIKSRIAQLQGDGATAIRNYLLVQLDELPERIVIPQKEQPGKAPTEAMTAEVPKRELLMNLRAAEDAKYWMGICQMEIDQKKPQAAVETLSAYLGRYGQGGNWVIPAALFRGIALARDEKYALAVQSLNQLLKSLPEDDPRRPQFELLVTRWRASRDAGKQNAISPEGNTSSEPGSATGTASDAKEGRTSAKNGANTKTP